MIGSVNKIILSKIVTHRTHTTQKILSWWIQWYSRLAADRCRHTCNQTHDPLQAYAWWDNCNHLSHLLEHIPTILWFQLLQCDHFGLFPLLSKGLTDTLRKQWAVCFTLLKCWLARQYIDPSWFIMNYLLLMMTFLEMHDSKCTL